MYELYQIKSFDEQQQVIAQQETFSIKDLIKLAPNVTQIFKTIGEDSNQFYQVKTTALNEGD